MKKLLSPFLFCLLAATCLFAQKQECYVITAAGQRQKAMSISHLRLIFLIKAMFLML